MATYTKRLLSGSTNGKAIKIAATATPGTLLHTAVAGTNDLDEVWVYLHNTSANPVTVTFEYGSATAPDDNIVVTIASKAGLTLVIPGLLLQNGLTLAAFASAGNVVTAQGFVNRISA